MKYYPETNKFQVAISFSEESSPLAKDIYHFLEELGISCYYYKEYSDRTKGLLEDKIEEIYMSSDINLMIWTEEYEKKYEDAIVSVEKQTLYTRHQRNNEQESLFILVNDLNKTEPIKISNRFNRITYHSLSKLGLFATRNAIVDRLIDSYSYFDKDKMVKMIHPPKESLNRGSMSFCKFKIDPNYNSDNRWNTLADIRINITYSKIEIPKSLKVYLIPSGRVTNLLSHSTILRTQKMSLNMKRKITKRFIAENLDKELTGYLFFIFAYDIEYPNAYSIKFDDYLNQKLLEK